MNVMHINISVKKETIELLATLLKNKVLLAGKFKHNKCVTLLKINRKQVIYLCVIRRSVP
jgi:hypothetical protein